MRYIIISFLALLCVKIQGAEKNTKEVIFTEGTSTSVTLTELDNTAYVLFLKYTSSKHVILYATAPIGKDIDLLIALKKHQEQIDTDEKILDKACFIKSSLSRVSSEDFSRCLRGIWHYGSFSDRARLKSNITVTYNREQLKIRYESEYGSSEYTRTIKKGLLE